MPTPLVSPIIGKISLNDAATICRLTHGTSVRNQISRQLESEQTHKMESLVFSVPQLAALISVHPDTIRRAIAAGELKAAHGGGRSHYRISRADAQNWWESRGGGILFPEIKPVHSQSNGPSMAEKEMTHIGPGQKIVPPDRIAAILALRGSMKRAGDEGRRVERFMEEKHADTKREEAAR